MCPPRLSVKPASMRDRNTDKDALGSYGNEDVQSHKVKRADIDYFVFAVRPLDDPVPVSN
jgi:hypothetical protein